MPILVQCKCGKKFQVIEKYAGKRIKCPSCAGPVDVSGTSKTTVACLCGAKLRAYEKDTGRTGKCPRCGRGIAVSFIDTSRDPRMTNGVVCSGCSLGSPPSRDNPYAKDGPVCSQCGFRGSRFTGEPGSVWRNETDKYYYQLTPSFRACCGVCLQSAHYIGPSWGIPRHVGCECRHKPVKPGETSLPFIDLADLLRTLTPAQQDALMGRNNWMLFRAGLAGWSDVVTEFWVRDLQSVVCVRRISVDAMLGAGIARSTAEEAYRAAHGIANESKRRVREALRGNGWSEERIQGAVGRDIDW